MRQAYTTEDPGRFEIRDVERTPPGPGEVEIRVRACGICGSDLHALHYPERWQAGRCLGPAGRGAGSEAGAVGWLVLEAGGQWRTPSPGHRPNGPTRRRCRPWARRRRPSEWTARIRASLRS